MRKKFIRLLLLILVLGFIYVAYSQYPRLHIVAGYSAKSMNSSVFLADRDVEFTDSSDNNFSPINLASDEVNKQQKTSAASVFGLLTRKAVYREGLGSVLVTKNYDPDKKISIPNRVRTKVNLPYPFGHLEARDSLFDYVDYSRLNAAINKVFDSTMKTRAVLVLHKDHIVAERYSEGFDKNAKLLGWSMTKSITGTIFGILRSQGKLKLRDPAPIESWKGSERAKITIANLLEMNSGLEWLEDYNTISDVTKMLFLAENMGRVQEDKSLVGAPNELWNYSSGTTNLLSNISRSYFKTHQEYLDYWYSNLIDKIGMHSMTIEADLEGNFVGSSYGWATPRDWAKLGLLYLHEGRWNGEQIFDRDWMSYALKPTNGSEGDYGAQIWLNAGGFYPDAPRDLFSFNGYQGQRVFIIPSKDLVIVRMGLQSLDFNEFLKNIIGTIHEY